LGGLLGTLVQIATGSDSLALLAPWRVSVILMPLSTCLIIALPLARLVERIPPRLNWVQPVLVVACLAVIAGLARQGLTVQRGRFARYERQDVHAVMEFVRQSKASGQVYLIPPRDNRFDEFRTYTGAPAFINWKSHPYRDFEVMEWYQRNLLAKDFYNQEPDLACQTLANIVAQVPVTHVVVDLEKEPSVCASMQETYADPYFAVYALSTPQPGY
jgi:hypothetical protein